METIQRNMIFRDKLIEENPEFLQLLKHGLRISESVWLKKSRGLFNDKKLMTEDELNNLAVDLYVDWNAKKGWESVNKQHKPK